MNPAVTWALGAGLTVALFVIARFWAVADKLRTENQALRDANYDLKLAIVELKGTARVVDRTLSALPATSPEGGAP